MQMQVTHAEWKQGKHAIDSISIWVLSNPWIGKDVCMVARLTYILFISPLPFLFSLLPSKAAAVHNSSNDTDKSQCSQDATHNQPWDVGARFRTRH